MAIQTLELTPKNTSKSWISFCRVFILRPPPGHIYTTVSPKSLAVLALLPEKMMEKTPLGVPNVQLPAGPRCLGQVTPKAVVQGHDFETHLDEALRSSETPRRFGEVFLAQKKSKPKSQKGKCLERLLCPPFFKATLPLKPATIAFRMGTWLSRCR